MYTIKNNFLSNTECSYLINYYLVNEEKTYRYRNTFPLSILNTSDSLVVEVLGRIEEVATELADNSIKLDNAEIVMWPENSFMGYHKDPAKDELAAILYLNSNFIGGETEFKTFKVKPETGTLVFFKNSLIDHGVSKVEKGTRYTLATWFVSKC